MDTIYIVCFVLLGIGALGDLIAFGVLLFSLWDGVGCNDSKRSRSRSFKLFIDKSVIDSDFNSRDLDSRKSGEDNKPIDHWETIN